MRIRFWRDAYPYLELGTTASFRSDDIFSVNESVDEENASGVNLVHRRRNETKTAKQLQSGRFSKMVWIFLALFLLLLIPMLGLSISAGIKRRKATHPHPKNMEDKSGFDQDTFGDIAFPNKDEITDSPSKAPLVELIEESTVIPSPAPHSQDNSVVSSVPTMPTTTTAPILVRRTEGPTADSATEVPSAEVLAPTYSPTISPTTKSPTTTSPTTKIPTIAPSIAPTTVFEAILSQLPNTDILTLPPEAEGILYIGVGKDIDINRANVIWKTDRLFQTDPSSIATTLPCMDMKPQALRGLFCKVRTGSQSYEIIPPTRDTDTFTAILYVYNDGTPFNVVAQEELVAAENGKGIFQVETEPFTIPSGVDGMISLQIQGDLSLAGLAIVPQKVVDEPTVEALPTKEPQIEDDLPQIEVESAPEESAGITPTSFIPTYIPGQLTVEMMGLLLSQGLQVKLLAQSGKPVDYVDGSSSEIPFHVQPDAGATYALDDGGWIYVSNSEAIPVRGERRNRYPGGVGAFTFSAEGNIINYEMVLTDTRANCGGGRTPWGAWISGEEYNAGKIWQVDPTGERQARRITMGEVKPGLFESFAYDTRDMNLPRFFMTKDEESGALRRFTPADPDWSNPWEILTGSGNLDFLVLEPEDVTNALLGNDSTGAFYWAGEYDTAAESAFNYYPHSEGIDVDGRFLYFVSKKMKIMYILDLDLGTYESHSTESGLFNGQPDQIVRLFDENIEDVDDTLVYFTEDGGRLAGVHARNVDGQFFTILESNRYRDETTGLSFSPDGKHMYVAYQDNGLLFDVTRTDGSPFYSKTLNVKYHNIDQ